MIDMLFGAILMICSVFIAFDHRSTRWPESPSTTLLLSNTTIFVIGVVMVLLGLYDAVHSIS